MSILRLRPHSTEEDGRKLKNIYIDLEIVMNELRRFKHSADFLANSSHIIESAAISAS